MKTNDIVAALRADVLTGRFTRSQKVPSRQELCERFGASPVTVQRAVDKLVTEGVLITRPRSGTFVADMPPCVSQVALIFPFRVYSAQSLFWDALSMSALALESRGMRFIRFRQISGNDHMEDYRKLYEQIEAGALAGLIFIHPPANLIGTPLLSAAIPKVTIMRAGGNSYGVPAICYEADAFITRALDRVSEMQLKRIAILNASSRSVEYLDSQTALLAEKGLATKPAWIMGSDTSFPHWTFNNVRSLVDDRPREQWPDALIITDDNLVIPAVEGLISAGVRIPDDINIIAHCNYPAYPFRAAKLIWLGFDSRKIMELCLDSLERQRTGRESIQASRILPVFEEELKDKQ